MENGIINPDETLVKSQVGHISEADSNIILASCFPVSANVIVTCCHAINVENVNAEYTITWPMLQMNTKAKLICNEVSKSDDVAFLEIENPLPNNIRLLAFGIQHTHNGDFLSFGYRKAEHYSGLFSTGKVIGIVGASDGRELLQLQSNGIDRGMSGAPVFDSCYRTVVGMVSEFWKSNNFTDSSLAFAIPMSRLVKVRPKLHDNINNTDMNPDDDFVTGLPKIHGQQVSLGVTDDNIVSACSRAVLLVSADQFPDGAWGRSLWKETGNHLTSDVADKVQVMTTHVKKAISVTSWAAQALAKISSPIYMPSIENAVQFTLSHQEERTGAFGNLYMSHSATPLVSSSSLVRSPRHTASGIKLLEFARGLSREVVMGCEFIVKNECPEGGWGEAIADSPNTLSTAYVLDVLIKLFHTSKLKELLRPEIAKAIKPAIFRGLTWLIGQKDHDNLWKYTGKDEYKPYYSANILGFTPQLANVFYDETIESIDALFSLNINGGIPATLEGNPDATTTALCLLSMLRINPEHYEKQIKVLVSWLVTKINSGYWSEKYSCMQGIFVLLALLRLPNFPQVKMLKNIEKMFVDNSIADYELSNDPIYWLRINAQFDLRLNKTIEEFYT